MPQTPTPPTYYILTPQSQPRTPIALPTERRALVARLQRLMGTTVSAQIACSPFQEAQANAAADRCMAWFAKVNTCLSRFDPTSEISALNRSAGRWFAASPTLFAAVTVALAAAHGSDGLFDPTLLGRLESLGYDRDFAQIAHREVASNHAARPLAPQAEGGWRAIQLDRARRRIRLPADVALDLGGIAKGWAADVAFMRYCGSFPGALLNVGGDLRAHGGPQPGAGWTVGVRDPRRDGLPDDEVEVADLQRDTPYLAIITISRGGLATSGAARRWWLRNGERQHHLLDPRTSEPIPLWTDGAGDTTLLATATALAPTATQAEVAAKVALLHGPDQALATVDTAWDATFDVYTRHGTVDTPLALLLVDGAGELRLSRSINDYLASWATEGGAIPPLRPWLDDEINAGVDWIALTSDIPAELQTEK
ncbi:MAG: FAD:protein FMN transferase [Ktedonobacterales bacterium]